MHELEQVSEISQSFAAPVLVEAFVGRVTIPPASRAEILPRYAWSWHLLPPGLRIAVVVSLRKRALLTRNGSWHWRVAAVIAFLLSLACVASAAFAATDASRAPGADCSAKGQLTRALAQLEVLRHRGWTVTDGAVERLQALQNQGNGTATNPSPSVVEDPGSGGGDDQIQQIQAYSEDPYYYPQFQTDNYPMFCNYGAKPYFTFYSSRGTSQSWTVYYNFADQLFFSTRAGGACAHNSCFWLSFGPRKTYYRPDTALAGQGSAQVYIDGAWCTP
jgi:hypothetical protein